MLRHRIQQGTAWLALALLGSVGGLGTGLHKVFNCCHCCWHACEPGACRSGAEEAVSDDHCVGCSFCNLPRQAFEHGERSIPSRVIVSSLPCKSKAGSGEDCAICQLLSHFHSLETVVSSQRCVWANRGTVTISVPTVVANSSHRLEPPRGPPETTLPSSAAFSFA